jgi:hypothetical protein
MFTMKQALGSLFEFDHADLDVESNGLSFEV